MTSSRRIVILLVVAAFPFLLPAVDKADAAAIGDPDIVQVLRILGNRGDIKWVSSDHAPQQIHHILKWEGGAHYTTADVATGRAFRPARGDAARGYSVFPWHYMVRMLPNSRPERAGGAITVAAAPGEVEPAVMGVLPHEDLSGVSASVSELSGGRETVIPSSAAALYWVNFVPRRIRRGRPDEWSLGPAVLTPMRPVDMLSDVAREIWLSISVPSDAEPGTYSGTIEIQASGKEPAVLELTLTVRNVRLGTPAPVVYAPFYGVPSDKEQVKLEMEAARERGINSLTPMGIMQEVAEADREGKITSFDFSRADEFMAEFKSRGFSGPVLLYDLRVQGRGGRDPLRTSYGEQFLAPGDRHDLGGREFFKCMKQAVAAVQRHGRDNKWPEVIVYATCGLSEWSDKGGDLVRFGIKLLDELRSGGGLPLCASLSGPGDPRYVRYPKPDELNLLALADIVMFTPGVPINRRTVAKVHENAGLSLWFRDTGPTRFSHGYMLWATGASGCAEYRLDGKLDDDGLLAYDGLLLSIPGFVIATTDLERVREGIDDIRYIRTLERTIMGAKTSEHRGLRSLAEKARERLAQVRKGVCYDMSRETVEKQEYPGLESIERYDAWRNEFAGYIEEMLTLQEKINN